MAIFNGTPIIVAPAPDYLQLHDFGDFSGRIEFEGKQYLYGNNLNGGGLLIARSLDDGATWNYYFGGSTTSGNGNYSGVLDEANRVLVFIFVKTVAGVRRLRTISFDVDAETFSSVTVSVINPGGDLSLTIRPNGEIICVFDYFISDELYGVEISGGTFGTPFAVVTGVDCEVRSGIADSSNVIHQFYLDRDADALMYVQIDASNTPGTPVLIDDTIGNLYLTGNAVINGDRVDVSGGLFDSTAWQASGTPLSAPTFTFGNLHTSTAPSIVDAENCALVVGSLTYYFYSRERTSPHLLEIMRVSWDGSTLGTPEVYWDILANPPAGATGSTQTTDGITADYLSGNIGVTVYTSVTSGGTRTAVLTKVSVGSVQINRFY